MKTLSKKVFFVSIIIPALFLGIWLLFFHASANVDHDSVSYISHDEHDHDDHNDETKKVEHKDEHEGEHHEEDIVKLTKEQLDEFGIKVSTAKGGKLQKHIKLTGEIIAIPDRLAHIVPRFPGIVKEVRKKIGDKVDKGEVLAIIESNESLTAYQVKSFIKGRVIDMHMSRGEVITSDNSGHSFIVADLTKVWATFNIYQKDLISISVGQQVVITGTGLGKSKGKISYISPVVDEKTRTATARVVLPNRNGRWKPGIFVTGNVVTKITHAQILVPNSAIFTFKGQKTIFIKSDAGFLSQKILTGISNEESTEITNGLKKGQEYISKGGFSIKAELMKESFGGHNH